MTAGLRLENVQQLPLEELRQRLLGLNTLLTVTRDLAAEIDTHRILERITIGACRALECDRASLYRYDPDTDELYTSVVTELEISEIRHTLDYGISGYVARHRLAQIVNDPQNDPRWNRGVDLRTGYHTRNILAAPLISLHDSALLGVLELINKQGDPFEQFDVDLIAGFGQHAAVALDRARLIEELKRTNEMEASLHVAREIQRGFMPQRLPQIPGYEIASWWYPNQAVGGDYCDVLRLADGRLGLIVADVSGHGIGPSLLMASVRSGLRALALERSAADELLRLLARALAPDLQNGRFITMVVVDLDPLAHRVEYANAGHAPALHYAKAADRFSVLEPTGLPLGVLDEPDYGKAPCLRMEPGDLIVLCTDGIVEAMDLDDNQFGVGRLQALIRRNAAEPTAQLVERIGEAVSAHYVGENPPDDLTILAARRVE